MNNKKYGFKVLSDDQCDQIYNDVKSAKTSAKTLAIRFGVSDRTIGRVVAKVESCNLGSPTNLPDEDVVDTVVESDPTDSVQNVTTPEVAPVVTESKPAPSVDYSLYDQCKDEHPDRFFANTDGLTVTVTWNGIIKSVQRSEVHFMSIYQALINDGPKEAYLLMAGKHHAIEKLFGTNNPNIRYESGKVFYKNVELHFDTVVTAIHRYANDGDEKNVAKLLNFLDKLILNPSVSAIKMLYTFISHNNIEISDDGDLIAFKAVNADFKDIHSRTIDNSVGRVVKMDRSTVVEDPSVTCASGLHACSWQYLTQSGFGSSNDNRYLKVKINPKDVVSVPNDYNGTKMRCCEYTVIELIG